MFLGSVLERVLGFSSNLYSAVYFRLMMRPVRLVQVLIANSCKSFGMKCVSLSQTYPCILCYNTKGCYNTMVMFFLILSYKRVASIGLCLSYRVTLFFLFILRKGTANTSLCLSYRIYPSLSFILKKRTANISLCPS